MKNPKHSKWNRREFVAGAATLALSRWTLAQPTADDLRDYLQDQSRKGQSTRTGWGATPYNGGFTFRVWAPHATSVTVPGVFNSWSTTASPLVQEKTNGVVDGVWSADVAGVANDSQYKYFITYNGSGNYKHDPRARWVTAAGGGSGAGDRADAESKEHRRCIRKSRDQSKSA